ncbi:YDG domain-containing protein, partial [Flavobacterium sp. SUN052]|uniref:YDG domain-containing protein n=1 Tax=Flavobacterium sp. SUN052 TaxID=3002441 RepID=UPI00237DF3BF
MKQNQLFMLFRNFNKNNSKNDNFSGFKTNFTLLILLIGLLTLPTTSFGQIYTNTFTGASACPTNGNTPVMATNSTGTAVSRNTITCNATANVFNSTTLVTTSSLSATSYIEFSATANASYKLNLTTLSFLRQASASAPNQLEVRYSTDGFATFTTWGAAPVSPTTGTTATWDFTDFSTPTAGTVTFRIYPYGTQRADLTGASAATGTFRIDDLTLNGTVTLAAIPTISSAGTLIAVNTTYGTASAETTFNVSGANMSAGILVTPPSGYEVSLTSGGTFTSTVTVGASGTIASTPVYVRIKSNATVAGSPYSGNIVLTSASATTVNVATVSSSVTAKALTISGITANNKVFDGNTSATLSGTASLVGVVNSDVVTLGGTAVATFASSSVGTAIPVSVTGYTLSGSGAGNYTLTQPSFTANITNAPTPVITSALTASATYGIAAATYTITATNAPTSYNATGLPAGLSIDTNSGQITGTPTGFPAASNVTISATNAGGTTNATLVYTILAKPLTVSGAVADNKIYDKTTVATISGSILNGVVGGDIVTISNTGTFASALVNTGITVTSTQTLTGTDAAKYSVSLPTGLSSDITAKALTISGAVAANKQFDGTTTATISGTLSGIISGDVVNLVGTGTFASSAIGNAIAVTSTSTITGADATNYSLTQPTGLTANITAGPTTLVAGDVAVIDINSANPDTFSIVLLKDIGQNTVINFTDNGFTGTDTSGRTGEGFLTFTAPTALAYGTVLTWTNGMSITGTGWSSNAPTNFSFNGSGDQLFLFQGSTTNWASQSGITLLFGMNYGIALSSTSGASNTLQPNASILPATAFVNLPTSTYANGYFSNTGLASTAVNVCGTPAMVLAAIVTPAKWFGTSATAATFPSFTITTVCPTPTISSTGTLTAVNTIYGTASSTTTFSVSGTDMNAGILVTPPTGYQVSLSSGSGYASTITVGAAGTIASTTVYVRIPSTTNVGTYFGDIVLTSSGAANLNVATVSSAVTPKALTISGLTANSKLYDGNTSATLSGTAALVGIVNSDIVTLGGTPVATFATPNAGTNILVSVTGYSISGSGATNYTLTQPSLLADITTVPSPVIISSLTANGVYGVVSTTYTITASNSPTAFNATGLPTGLVINTTNGTISGTPTGFPGVFNVTISATNAGGTGNATLVYTISPKPITVSGAVADNKVYTKTNAATISGSTLVGVIGTDVVTISNTGTFASVLVANGIVVTSTQTLAGADAAKYSVTLPSGLTANITTKSLTISTPLAQNKQYDGTTAATITGTLSGLISGDVVTLNGTGIFASSAIANGIAVTSTATLSGADATNYSLTQPTGLTANITQPVLYLNQFTGASACPTNGNVPTMATNATGTPLTRNTIACNPTANVFNSLTLNNTSTVSNTSYIEFSATAVSGRILNVSALSFFRQASASAPNQLEVRYSTDGFATSTSWGAAPNSPTTGSVITWDFADFITPSAGTVTFRVYPYGTQRADLGAGAAASTGTFRLDDVTIYGLVTLPIPPTSSVLSGTTSICDGDSATISVAITGGSAPYTVVYNDGTSNTTVTGYLSNSNIIVSPTTNTTYTLVSVTDNDSLVGTGNSGSAVITLLPNFTYYADNDNDGFGDINNSIFTCSSIPGYVLDNTDCDDTNAAIHSTFSFYVDSDNDTYGAGIAVSVCVVNATTPPTGYSVNNTDCDDTNATIYRSALLYADADADGYNVGSAVTCYGATLPTGTSLTTLGTDCDDTNATIYRSALLYTDVDNDGYNAGSAVTCYGATLPAGTSLSTLGSDCNDSNAAVHSTYSFYTDADGDSYGTGTSQLVCAVSATTPPTGYSVNSTDCDDTNATIYRSALLYTDVDNDGYNAGSAVTCYGATLPTGTSLSTLGSDCNDSNAAVHATYSFYTDADGDGYGSVSATAQSLCAVNATTPPVSGYSSNNTDCDDTKSSVHPGAVDVCYDAIDNDCNGNVDNVGMPGGCTPKVANLPTTTCGSTVSALNTVVSAVNVPGAQAFRFKITNMTTNTVQVLDSPSISFQFMNLPGVTFATQYKIEVAIKFAGVWQGFYGSPCFVNTPSPVSIISAAQCGSTLTSMSQYINSSYVANVTGYRYEVTNQSNGQTQYVYSSLNKFTLTQLLASNQSFNTNYFVRVSCRNTDGTYLPEGPGCIIKSPAFPTTQVVASLCNNYLVPSMATNISVDVVSGATLYKFRLFNGTYDFV